jgi:hypothetical protein
MSHQKKGMQMASVSRQSIHKGFRVLGMLTSLFAVSVILYSRSKLKALR